MKSRSECLREYGSDYFIGKGEKFCQLVLVCYKYPNAIVTLNTAFYLYGLTDEIPDEHFLATKREAAPISDKRVRQIFMPKALLAIGKTTIEEKGYPIPVFDKERMLVELIRYKSKLPFGYYKEIIGNYRRILPQLNPEKIRDYAEVMPKSDMIVRTLKTEVY